MNKKDYIKKLEEDYNKEARLWNSVGDKKLVFPTDRFMIQECWCKKPSKVFNKQVEEWQIKHCGVCGYPLRDEWK